jgi:hypothetical protein
LNLIKDRDIFSTLLKLKKELGSENFIFWHGCEPLVVVSSPKGLEKVLNSENYKKGLDYKVIYSDIRKFNIKKSW